MKKLLKVLLIFGGLVIGFSFSSSYASSIPSGLGSGTSPGLTAPDLSIPGVGGPTATSGKLCEIKNLFCGKAALTIVAFSIFLMGIMILNHKLQWHTAVLIISGILIFYNADKVALMFNSNILVIPGNCSCF